VPVSPLLRKVAFLAPRLFPAATLHRLGLFALAAGDIRGADALLEGAALACRAEYETERLARVRVHQLMARALAHSPRDWEASSRAERALSRLEWIESIEAPFEMLDARTALATWASPARAVALAPRALQPSLFDRAA
jgi:hypothetical protein